MEIIKINKTNLLTDNHLVMTTNGLVEAKKLKVNMEIIDINDNLIKITKINKFKHKKIKGIKIK